MCQYTILTQCGPIYSKVSDDDDDDDDDGDDDDDDDDDIYSDTSDGADYNNDTHTHTYTNANTNTNTNTNTDIFKESPHVLNATVEAIESLTLGLGVPLVMQYIIQGLYHPARFVRVIFWKLYNR